MSNLPAFFMDPEGVDPAQVPHRTLAGGARMPAIGVGTSGSDHVTHEQVAAAVLGAASVGYRHFDCASVYGNEAQIGQVFAEIMTGVPREDLWITSKVIRVNLSTRQRFDAVIYGIFFPFGCVLGLDCSSRSDPAKQVSG